MNFIEKEKLKIMKEEKQIRDLLISDIEMIKFFPATGENEFEIKNSGFVLTGIFNNRYPYGIKFYQNGKWFEGEKALQLLFEQKREEEKKKYENIFLKTIAIDYFMEEFILFFEAKLITGLGKKMIQVAEIKEVTRVVNQTYGKEYEFKATMEKNSKTYLIRLPSVAKPSLIFEQKNGGAAFQSVDVSVKLIGLWSDKLTVEWGKEVKLTNIERWKCMQSLGEKIVGMYEQTDAYRLENLFVKSR